MGNVISRMAVAMQGWESLMADPLERPKGMFGQRVLIETATVKIDNAALDCEFSVPFSDDGEDDEAEIAVYNLTQNTISNLKYDDVITITAGYEGDTGVIFSGRISKVTTSWDGTDKKTTIYALDAPSLSGDKTDAISYKPGVKASYILKDLINRQGVPIAIFEPVSDHTYTDGANVSGSLAAAIQKYAKVCGSQAYMNKGKMHVRGLHDGDSILFVVSTETGLIGSPEPFEEDNEDENDTITGYKIEMLLQHRLTTASRLTLKSRDVNGVFRVRKGEHIYDGTNLLTECEVII